MSVASIFFLNDTLYSILEILLIYSTTSECILLLFYCFFFPNLITLAQLLFPLGHYFDPVFVLQLRT